MNPQPPLVIYGAGGHGRVVLDIALASQLEVTWVLDDAPKHSSLFGIPLARTDESHWRPASELWHFLIAVGQNSVRANLYQKARGLGGTPINLIHPKAVLTERCHLDSGITVIDAAELK